MAKWATVWYLLIERSSGNSEVLKIQHTAGHIAADIQELRSKKNYVINAWYNWKRTAESESDDEEIGELEYMFEEEGFTTELLYFNEADIIKL